MPSYLAVAGSCANVIPSIDLISRIPEGAVRRGAREHDADRMPAQRARERPKEEIDGVVLAAILGAPPEVEMAVYQLHLRVGRYHVDAIGHDARAFGRFDHGKGRMAGEQRRERARMMRREVLDENNREVRNRGQPLEKLCKCLEAACRRANPDDARSLRRAVFLRRSRRRSAARGCVASSGS